jgi:hypothetical protein
LSNRGAERNGAWRRGWYLEDVMCVFVREAMAAQRRGAVDAEVVLVVLALPRVHGARVEELLR